MQNPITLSLPKTVLDQSDVDEMQVVMGMIGEYVDTKESIPYSDEEILGMRAVPIRGLVG